MANKRFHIGRDGQPHECTAETGKCPLGGEHYDSLEKCETAVEKTTAHNNQNSQGLKKSSNTQKNMTIISSFASVNEDIFDKNGTLTLEPGEYVSVRSYKIHGYDNFKYTDDSVECTRLSALNENYDDVSIDEEPDINDPDAPDNYQEVTLNSGTFKGKSALMIDNDYYYPEYDHWNSQAGAQAIVLKKSDADALGIEYEDKNVTTIDSKTDYRADDLVTAAVDMY